MTRQNQILTYWFGSVDAVTSGTGALEKASLWFAAGNEVDREMRQYFGDDLELAGRGKYDSWEDDPMEHLALILLLDQFSRNIHRGTPRAFAFDDRGLSSALNGIDREHDRAVSPVARAFFYMPLEHAEQLGHQERCVELMEELVAQVPEEQRELFQGFADYARQHRDIIAKFGRFPHRNKILGRPSTPEERAFLAEAKQDFGQSVKES